MQSLDEFVEFGFLTSLQASKVLESAASHLGLRFEAASDQPPPVPLHVMYGFVRVE